jgi:hypothetical protein
VRGSKAGGISVGWNVKDSEAEVDRSVLDGGDILVRSIPACSTGKKSWSGQQTKHKIEISKAIDLVEQNADRLRTDIAGPGGSERSVDCKESRYEALREDMLFCCCWGLSDMAVLGALVC